MTKAIEDKDYRVFASEMDVAKREFERLFLESRFPPEMRSVCWRWFREGAEFIVCRNN